MLIFLPRRIDTLCHASVFRYASYAHITVDATPLFRCFVSLLLRHVAAAARRAVCRRIATILPLSRLLFSLSRCWLLRFFADMPRCFSMSPPALFFR